MGITAVLYDLDMHHFCFTAILAAIVLGAVVPGCAAENARITGSVVDGRGGEALSRVDVQLAGTEYRARSDAQGRFEIGGIPPGDYVLNASTVGYRLAKKPFHLDAGESKIFEIVLTPGTLTQTDSVEVKSGPFDVPVQAGSSPLILSGNDVTNLASVLANDPLRAVQDMPGVTANDDFKADFTIRGADFSRVGIYMDGILLHSPLHTVESSQANGSESAFNGGMVESLELYSGPLPPQYPDRTAGALEVHTRDGGRKGIAFRAEASFSNAGFTAEGPLDAGKHGSWLVSARQSYLQYIIGRISTDTSLVFGLQDVQARLTYDLTPKNNLSLDVLESYTDLDRSSKQSTLGVNSLMTAGYDYSLAKIAWRYSPNEKFVVHSRAAWMREKFDDENPKNLLLNSGFYGEWVGNQAASWIESPAAKMDFGWSVREIREQGYSNQYQSNLSARLLEGYRGNSTRGGGYLGQTWAGWHGMVHLAAGGRVDRDSLSGRTTLDPQASIAFVPAQTTRLQLAWGEYTQYPEVAALTSNLGNTGLLPARTIQFTAAVEQRLGERTRLRAEFYDRTDRDLINQPFYDPRILAYAYGRTAMRDGITHDVFPSDWDQRHSVNVYAGYRLRPSVNLSVRSVFGTGFPIPGYLTQTSAGYFLTSARNGTRLGNYERTDFRVNKNWTHVKWKTTLYGEVVNLTDRTNYRFDSFNGYNAKTGSASITLDKLFPILPSVGLVIER